ncbi:MAG: hypothetical protein KAT28_05435 [Candidatus Aenigmarchaeota archaeon]|nr:hypothetical protein [Candidatus Aenigmarchaeota archaeon]
MRPKPSFTTCNVCNYRAHSENFPNVHGESHEKYYEIMEKYGHKDITKGAGVVCPECGNHKDFTYNSKPD